MKRLLSLTLKKLRHDSGIQRLKYFQANALKYSYVYIVWLLVYGTFC